MNIFKVFKLAGIYGKATKFLKNNEQLLQGGKDKAVELIKGLKELRTMLKDRAIELKGLIKDCEEVIEKLKEVK